MLHCSKALKEFPFGKLQCGIEENYPQLPNKAVNILLPFPTAHV